MKALVTGGCGFIGSNIVQRLVERGDSVIVLDDLSTGNSTWIPTKARLVIGKVEDRDVLVDLMADVDIVFHFQAHADVRNGPQNIATDYRQNFLCTKMVLEAMRATDVKRIVFPSSAVVYGEPSVFPTPESYAGVQTSIYAANKLACEAWIQAYSAYFGIEYLIFRFVSWIGEHYHHGVIADFVNKLRINPSELEILGNGHQKKSYLYVKDGVDGIFGAIDYHKWNQIYNLGHSTFEDVNSLALTVCTTIGLDRVTFKYTGGERGWIGDSPFVHLDCSKINSDTGWIARTPIAEGVKRTVIDILSRDDAGNFKFSDAHSKR